MPKARINDLDLKKWKQYGEVLTDSLWLISQRDKSGPHNGDYHGNFVPQIPHQLLKRFTKKGDVVLDAFLGSGTTLIEARQLGRNGIGVELLPDVAKLARVNVAQTSIFDTKTSAEIVVGDSRKKESRKSVERILQKIGKKKIQLIILHPPYHDIIKFSSHKDDMSNAKSVEDFLHQFGQVVDNFLDLLEKRHFLAVVIGDKYTNSEWVPLGLYVLQEVLKRPEMKLKSLIVKNMVNNRAKRNQEQLWRYRALVGGFYVFRHEYVLLFERK